MTSWLDQKHIERRIIGCSSWQKVLDELEKPNGQFTPRHASSILKEITNEYVRIQQEFPRCVHPSLEHGISDEQLIAVACRDAVETIRQKAV
ncbi:MAG: hypothetical protein P8X39_07990 [Desulfofustis sp.]|jgi:hypothetical protein